MPIPLPKPHNPEHPGQLLKERLARVPDSPSQAELAARLGMSRGRLNELLNESRPVTLDTALRLERLFPDTPAERWMQLQAAYDLHQMRGDRKLRRELNQIERLYAPAAEPLRPARAPIPLNPARTPIPLNPGTILLPRLPTLQELEREIEAQGRERRYLLEFLERKGLLAEALRFARVHAQLATLGAPKRAPREAGARPFPDAPEFVSILRGER